MVLRRQETIDFLLYFFPQDDKIIISCTDSIKKKDNRVKKLISLKIKTIEKRKDI